MTLGEKIKELRNKSNLTQNELAEKLYCSYQAISQWENNVTNPDINLLPKIAQVFDVTIDELFGVEPTYISKVNIKNLNKDALYILVTKGENIEKVLDYEKLILKNSTLKVELTGDVKDVASHFSVKIDGDVHGTVAAGDGVVCGNIIGNVSAGDSVTSGPIKGDVHAGDSVTSGPIDGDVTAGDSVFCGNIEGNVRAGDSVTAQRIGGNVNATTVNIQEAYKY